MQEVFPSRVQKRGDGRIELPTSPTRTENHATRPCTLESLRKVLDPGIEPGTYCVLGSRHNQLDQPSESNPGGTRTPSLEIRSLTPYPVGPQGLDYWKWGGLGPRNGGHGTERTKIMVPPVGFEPTHLIRYLNLSQAP